MFNYDIYIYNLKGFNLCVTCQTRHASFHDMMIRPCCQSVAEARLNWWHIYSLLLLVLRITVFCSFDIDYINKGIKF